MNTNYPPAMLFGTHTRMLHSEIVGDDYELSIYLPSSYDSSGQVYPTLYVLDAPYAFGSAVSAAILQNWETDVPEIIVVGIGKRIKTWDEWHDTRWRDYTPAVLSSLPTSGGAAAFLEFIHQELVPFMDTNYRTQPDDRIIWGNSMGGTFAIYALFNRPGLFSRYIAVAPAFSWEGETAFDYELALIEASLPFEARLFVSVGALDHGFAPSSVAFMNILYAKKLPNLKFQSLVLNDLGHVGACTPAFYYGLQAVYAM